MARLRLAPAPPRVASRALLPRRGPWDTVAARLGRSFAPAPAAILEASPSAMAEIRHPAPFISNPPRRVLFLCWRNSARSQIAEGFGRALAPPGTEVWSSGTMPAEVQPAAIDVMREAGIDIADQRSKGLDDVPWREVDTVVTLCGEANEGCPVLASEVRRVHWPLPDPAASPESERLRAFREARDEIKWRVSSLWPGAR